MKDIQKSFDLAKKQLDGGSLSQGYSMGDGRIYTAYYTNEKWASFKTNMEALYPRAYDDFMSGYGNELSERNMKGKMVPPKMASYSSSSRFIFELSKDIPGFQFECKLPISIPGRKLKLHWMVTSPRRISTLKPSVMRYTSEAKPNSKRNIEPSMTI